MNGIGLAAALALLAATETGRRSQIALAFVQLFLYALPVEHEAAICLRDEGRIDDDVLPHIERELDLAESRLMLAS